MRGWERLLPARRKPLVFAGTSNPELAERIAYRAQRRRARSRLSRSRPGQARPAPQPRARHRSRGRDKTRPRYDVAEVAEVVGGVDGKTVVMGDDMIVTGTTLISAAEALLAAGAVEVRSFATHALFAEGALDRLQASHLAEVAVTDSVRISGPLPSKLTVPSIADVLAETVGNIFADRSVAAQFAGQELF